MALETSCDETAAAVVRGLGEVLASEIASQIELHRPYGGVVPEVASRNHTLNLRTVLETTLTRSGISLRQIQIFAATSGPGLNSSLLIGNTVAKALALASNRPFYAINHLEGHLLSPFQTDQFDGNIPPFLGLIVSGGHTMLVKVNGFGVYQLLGATRDDAAGEAFDKGAKMLGLPYPGGPEIERNARGGDPAAFSFPRGLIQDGTLDFSFSGLKTALLYQTRRMSDGEVFKRLPDLCASYQAAIVDSLVAKTEAACAQTDLKVVALSGGVSCNLAVQQGLRRMAHRIGLELRVSPNALATDNAAMIGFVASLRWRNGLVPSPLSEEVDPNLPLLIP